MDVKSNDLSFKTMMVFATEMINLLKVKFPHSSIDDWQGYLVQRLSLMLQTYGTFSKVLLEDKDYITANTILRMMVDNLAITKFIYVDHEGEMRLLRHYLFLLDGSLTFIKLTDSMENVDNLIGKGRERSIDEAQYIKGQITKLQLYKDNCKAINILFNIEKRVSNWKFYKFLDNKNFRFHELYSNLEIAPNIVAYLDYLSQFAHGLSLYSLGTVASTQNVPFLIETRNMLLGMLTNYIYKLFSEHIGIDNGLIESLRTKLNRNELEWFLELATNSSKHSK